MNPWWILDCVLALHPCATTFVALEPMDRICSIESAPNTASTPGLWDDWRLQLDDPLPWRLIGPRAPVESSAVHLGVRPHGDPGEAAVTIQLSYFTPF